LAGNEVEVLWKCIVCGRAFAKKQSLRAHMKKHKGEGLQRTSIWVNKEKWERFKQLCRKHNTTTCHLLDALIDAAIKGEEHGVVNIAGPNPVIINLTHVFLGRPRSTWKAEVPVEIPPGPHCPVCGAREVSETQPLDGIFREGRCLRCGATWLISPGGQDLSE